MSILEEDHATVRQRLQAKKIQIALNSSDAFHQIVPLVTKPLRKDQTMSMWQTIREIISRNKGNKTDRAFVATQECRLSRYALICILVYARGQNATNPARHQGALVCSLRFDPQPPTKVPNNRPQDATP